MDGELRTMKAMACIHPASVARAPDMTDTFNHTIAQFVHMIQGRAAQARSLEWEAVSNAERLSWIVDQILAEPDNNVIAVDCEWNGDYPTEANAWLRTIQLSHKPGKAVVDMIFMASEPRWWS
jgi:hypothetical protein